MGLMADFRAALRALGAARGFAAIAIFTLSTALALAVIVLSVVNAYVVRALPYPASDRLYRVDYAPPNQLPPRGLEQLDWAAIDDVVEFEVAWDLDVFYLLSFAYPESAPGGWVTQGYVNALGVRAAVGRVFDAADFVPGAPSVALISHRLWQTRFDGDAAVVGQTFHAYVNDRPDDAEVFTVIGVLPADLWHLNVYTEVLAPLKVRTYPYMVRLRPGVTPAVATERIDRLVRAGLASAPSTLEVTLTNAQDSYAASVRPLLWSVAAAAALVLLIASANVAVLTLVRGRRRERELAVRLALGASPVRIARLLALDGVLVGLVSLTFGLVLAHGILPFIAPMIERSIDRRIPGGFEAARVDGPVLAAAVICGVVVTLVLTVLPLMSVRRSSMSTNLTGAGRGATADSRAGRTRALLIAIEVAASLTLLAGAGLMVETALRMLRVDFGVDADDVVTASLALRQRSFPDVEDRAAFFERLLNELHGVGGTTLVGVGDWWPLQGSRPRRVESASEGAGTGMANPFAVSADYFATVGVPVRDGRTFTVLDRLGTQPVAVVSESLARRLWPGRAVGQSLTIHPDGEGQPQTRAVVGVVADVRQSHSDADAYDVYLPFAQEAGRFAFLYLRGPRSPTWETELRSAVARVSPEVALGTPRRLALGIEQERARPQFLAYLLSTFAAVAVLLALVGMHGVIAYAVRQRQREIAVRMAVGADARAVTLMFLRGGSIVLAAGLAVGVVGALALGRVLQSQLYEVQPAEPRVLALAVLVFAAIAVAAMLGPAWRASTTDPMVGLKTE
jgi:putative ABC transport system permease protein